MRTLKFIKRAGKYDDVEFWFQDALVCVLQNPKQRILPHDLVHAIIEQSFGLEGFVSLVFAGHTPGKAMDVLHGTSPQLEREYSTESWVTECLVESLQACLWSGPNVGFDDFNYAFEKACEARKLTPVRISSAQFSRAIGMTSLLSTRWENLASGESLELPFA